MSAAVSLQSGVRQGEILSPHLFAVYVDDLFEILVASGMGCYVNGFCVNSHRYADDLIVLALTLYDLRNLLKLCSEFFASLDMPLNISKSKYSRFGLRYKKECPHTILEIGTLKWASSFTYLGVSVVAGIFLSATTLVI